MRVLLGIPPYNFRDFYPDYAARQVRGGMLVPGATPPLGLLSTMAHWEEQQKPFSCSLVRPPWRDSQDGPYWSKENVSTNWTGNYRLSKNGGVGEWGEKAIDSSAT